MNMPEASKTAVNLLNKADPVRLLAFYLPQYHPTPYNDEWWGPGFTEWSNVVKARPRFPGHYQPHLPADLGFYDLRLPETRDAQARLAQEHGVYGFVYYHYWFAGKRLLETPLNEVLRLGRPEMPFCICWANENWTRLWDGKSRSMLLEQNHSEQDDVAHIRSLIGTLEDNRYIRIEGKPLVLIYRIELLPNPMRTAEIWREETKRAGLGDIFLLNVESSFIRVGRDPREFGFDASVRFQPSGHTFQYSRLSRALRAAPYFLRRDTVFPYRDLHRFWKAAPRPAYRRFDCVTPMWDNTARRKRKAVILTGSTPELYASWLHDAVEASQPDQEGHRWLFVNAWNEWAEGCHLEPCQKWGRSYLMATKRVIEAS